MSFQTSTPKKQTLLPLLRPSTPNKFYNHVKYKIKGHDHRPWIKGEKCCQHYQMATIKLDLLLYRPRIECYHHRRKLKQFWNI